MPQPSDHDRQALKLHKELAGKIEVRPKTELTPETLALLYTPGVGAVSRHLDEHPEEAGTYTLAGRTVAVVSDGSAVLGLGNIGPAGALPVMEGKALLFKALSGLDAFPIVLDTQDTEEVIAAVKAIAPTFAAINLEDISAPRCYEIERRLQAELDIPVMHDDQHATAIVVLAGLINAAKVTERDLAEAKIVLVGAGAAGSALVRLLSHYGARNLWLYDSKGLVRPGRDNLDPEKAELAPLTSAGDADVSLTEGVKGAEFLIGLSSPEAFGPEHVKAMAERSVVFALANPTPEVMPDEARTAGAEVIATGRSDFPNQINNVLVFPGFFKGAIGGGARDATMEMKVRAAEALARLVEEPSPEKIIPSVFDARVVPAVAEAVAKTGD